MESKSNSMVGNEKPKSKYPKAVGFIVSNEFCERFNYYGMRTILVLYLTRKLGYDDTTATILFHIFTSLVYFFPLFGAILADSWLGRYKTILYLSIIYSLGAIIIAVGAIPVLHLPAKTVTVIGLILIALGTGGIKPCVSAFGGDQFKLPEQVKQLATFFSLFYFTINAGSLLSTSITPILREDVYCFNDNDCFSLAFGVPAALMILSIVIFVFGKPLYVIKKPVGNMLVSVFKCVTEAIRKKSIDKKTQKDHWLDYAEPKYGKQLVNDTKSLFKILVLYLPLPIFWALFDQQGSRWTFQATRMVGDVGLFKIKPDQMQVINPLLILLFIPLFDYYFYPFMDKLGIKRPLQKLTLGGILAGVAFVLSGIVEIHLEKTDPILPGPQEAQLRIYNPLPCDYNVLTSLPNYKNFTIQRYSVFEKKNFSIQKAENYSFLAVPTGNNYPTCLKSKNRTIKLIPGRAMSYFFKENNTNILVLGFKDNPEKPHKGYPMIRIISSFNETYSLILKNLDTKNNDSFPTNNVSLIELKKDGNYDILLNRKFLENVDLKLGGVYVIMLDKQDNDNFKFTIFTLTQPNSIHILWQIPQYVVITAGEVMFSVTGLEFSFSQAPASMKSVLQACWLLAVAFGNLIVVFIAEFTIFKSQSAEFFLFAALMIIDMIVFILLALRYKYVNIENDDEDNTGEEHQMTKPKSSSSNGEVTKDENKGHTNKTYEKD